MKIIIIVNIITLFIKHVKNNFFFGRETSGKENDSFFPHIYIHDRNRHVNNLKVKFGIKKKIEIH